MVSAWRIVKARFVKAGFAANAFDGEGARRSGGRWNSPGTSLVYASSTASLAMLEMLVHLGSAAVLPGYVLIECRFDPALVLPLQRAILPANWQEYPAPAEVRAIGDRWVRQGRSVVLEVPSVILPQEHNFLLNPAHPKFSSLKILPPTPLRFDARLLRQK